MCYFRENFEMLTKYCKEHISKEHLLGMLQTSWAPTVEASISDLNITAETIKAAKTLYDSI